MNAEDDKGICVKSPNSPMHGSRRKFLATAGAALALSGCRETRDPDAIVFLIESSPTALDPRIESDAQSERINQLIFDPLVELDQSFQPRPALAERWEFPNPLSCVFHLRSGVHFHDGRALTSRDVRHTFTSILEGRVSTTKASTFRSVTAVETPDGRTVIFRFKEPYASFLSTVSQGAIGIVPDGAGKDFLKAPVGTGAFKFVSSSQDEEVIVERNTDYWRGAPRHARVRFKVAPDATVRALELRKGSADVAINALTADMVRTLQREPHLRVVQAPGAVYQYIGLNVQDPALGQGAVRRALAHAIDRQPLIEYLWRNQARPASSVLPPNHWAFCPDAPQYSHDPERARALLDAAGLRAGPDGVRLRLTMKTSTEETSRLLAAVVQQQLREVGVAVELRSNEFATFYADVVKGAFQMCVLRWIRVNNDPDVFEYCFHSRRVPPKGANRGRYSNPRLDTLLDASRSEMDQEKRRAQLFEIQRILNADMPYLHLWYYDNVVVHSDRLSAITPSAGGDYDFLKTV
jgi:peptide/nickel transport system substrate-binding protein